tara:strand:+ start:340 stop:576 length:237 start_codon:yes stop_codon:yes gene_type:complete
MNEEFEIEMPGANEEYQYALELIKNMAGIADDLDPDVFAETMLIYAVTYHLSIGNTAIVRDILSKALASEEQEAMVCH